MLRSVLSRGSSAFVGRSRAAGSHINHLSPSTTTSVLMTRLPNSVVESELQTALAEVQSRRISLEPGCSLHFVNECEAKIAAKTINSKFNTKSYVSPISMPSLLLQNIPDDISADFLTEAFGPQSIHIRGNNTVRVTLPNSHEALLAMTAIHKVHIEGHTLRATGVKLANGSHILSVFNFPNSRSVENVVAQVEEALTAAHVKHSGVDLVSQHLSGKKSATLRFPALKSAATETFNKEEFLALINESQPDAFTIARTYTAKKPALHFRKIVNLPDLHEEIGEKEGVVDVKWLRRTPDVVPHMAIATYTSEAKALEDLHAYNTAVFEDQKIAVTYKEVFDHVVEISNIHPDTEESELEELVTKLTKNSKDYMGNYWFAREAENGTFTFHVDYRDHQSARLAAKKFTAQVLHGQVLAATAKDMGDHCVEIVPTGRVRGADLTQEAVDKALAQMKNQENRPVSVAFKTNTDAYLSFLSIEKATQAQKNFNSGKVTLSSLASQANGGSMVASSLTALPAYVLQVQDLGVDVPVRSLTEHLAAELPTVKVIKTDRSALVKFKRNNDVLPGMEQLKTTLVDGQRCKVERYTPLQPKGDSAYDTHSENKIDKLNLVHLVKDMLHLDPATRYQIAKNAFQIRLFDARRMFAREDIPESTAGEMSAAPASSIDSDDNSDSDEDNSGSDKDNSDGEEEKDELSDEEIFTSDDYRGIDGRYENATDFRYEHDENGKPKRDEKGLRVRRFLGALDMYPEEDNFDELTQMKIMDLFKMTGYAAAMSAEEADAELFRYYLQTHEMKRYAADFAEIADMIGVIDAPVKKFGKFNLSEKDEADRLAKEYILKKNNYAALKVLKKFERSVEDSAFGGNDSDNSGSEEELDPSEQFDLAGMGSDDFDSDFELLEEPPKPVAAVEEEDGSDSGDEADRAAAKKKKHRDENMHMEDDGEGNMRMVYRNPNKDLKFIDDGGNRLNVITDKFGDYYDASGTAWAMIVVDTDTVQKTLAGGRFVTHRALVTMGNLKGTGGFGMGKGKGPAEALTAACRNALRNLVHIDLYENASLAHDLFGKHNACRCVIRATPKSREMVASPMIEEILHTVGVASASVKMIGNRNPYSQVNALFNALSHHQNLDEFAKARGKRYLTVRWAHENNL